MGLTSNDEYQLEVIAELLYPVTDDMCIRRKTEERNKRVVFVWKMKKELKQVSDSTIKTVINELKAKTDIKP